MLDTQDTELLLQENRQLRARLEELEEILRTIRNGEVDALIVSGAEGEQVYTLRGALEPYRVMVETMSEGAVTLAPNGTIFYCNGRFAALVKTAQEYIVAVPFHHWVAAQDLNKFDAILAQGQKGIIREELLLQASDGTHVPIYLSLCPLPDNAAKGIAAVITDLTEFKLAEHNLKERIKELRAFYYISELAEREDLSLDNLYQEVVNILPNSWQYPESTGARIIMNEIELRTDNFRLTPWMQTAPIKVRGSVAGKIEVAYFEHKPEQDEGPFIKEERQLLNAVAEYIGHITARKQADDALRRANRALQTLSAGNMALLQATSEEELLRTLTNVIVEKGGYSLARVLYAEDNTERSIIPIAWSSSDNSTYWSECLSWADSAQSQLPILKAIRSGTTQICHNIAAEPAFKPWKETALARGYVSNIALPFFKNGKVFGGLCIYASEKNAFDAEEVRLLEELANDLGYGIVTLRTRRAHERHEATLRQSLEQSIQAIAGTVEARDPYTAGHQRRVAALATAIAREMGLPDEQINGIHLAAIIHDLGKVHVPAEILSKPGKLSDIEFMLIKTHPQAGYDIIKDVKFPWPIADIVLQHHEKLDGSGYPCGLKGEQILLESKIITVADVVEAISSHRPYRPGLGMDVAFEELRRNRGVQYDAQIVDACIRLFQEKNYQLPP